MRRNALAAAAIAAHGNVVKELKVWEKAAALARTSPSQAIEAVGALLTHPTATKGWIEKELGRGSKPGGIHNVFAKVGDEHFGRKHEWLLDEIELRGPAIAKALAAQSPAWTDDQLWVYLQSCLVRRWAEPLGPKELKTRPTVRHALEALARPAGNGDGAKLLDSLRKSVGIMGAPAPKRGRGKPGPASAPHSKLPKTLPRTLADGFALLDALGLGAAALARKKPSSEPRLASTAKKLRGPLPADLAELYRRCDGLGGPTSIRIAAIAELPGLTREFRDWAKGHLAQLEGEPLARSRAGLDLRALLPLEPIVAFGTWQQPSNMLLFDSRLQTADGDTPVLLFEHDGELCRFLRPSLGALVAAIGLEAAKELDPANAQIDRLLAAKPPRVSRR